MKFINELTVTDLEGMQMGSDTMIAAAAWVSKTPLEALKRAKENPDDVKGVINYLIKNRHGTPFEHGGLTVYCHLPIFVWREWHRHRISFSYNEESARYHKLEPVFYIPSQDRPMMKVGDWKPSRPKFQTLKEAMPDEESQNWLWTVFYDNKVKTYEQAYSSYEFALEYGIDPGLARIDLPVGIYSSCWVTCNPRSIMSFLSLRVSSEDSKYVSYPLWEIDQAAQKLENIFKHFWPITHEAFVKNGRVAP